MNRIPSIRVTDAADAAVLGLWHRSDQVSRRHSWRSIIGGPLLLLLGILFVVAAFLVPGPWWLFLPLLGLPALCVLVAGISRTYAELFRLRIGPLIMHRFDEGFVAERPRGPLRAVAFAELKDARLIDHHGADGAMVLLLMVHWDGTAWACPRWAMRLTRVARSSPATKSKSFCGGRRRGPGGECRGDGAGIGPFSNRGFRRPPDRYSENSDVQTL